MLREAGVDRALIVLESEPEPSIPSLSVRVHQTRSRANPGGMDVAASVLGSDVLPFRTRKPPWFKVPSPGSPNWHKFKRTIADEGLHTVCRRRPARTSATAGTAARRRS